MHTSSPSYEDLDVESRIRLDKVIGRFEIAFLDNPATRLEDFLGAARKGKERAVLLLELLCAELEYRREGGEVPTIDEYLLRLPDDADAVRAAFRVPLDGLAGARLGKYQLTRLIGHGGMGTVYAATDTVVKRQVAVKILSESLASQKSDAQRNQKSDAQRSVSLAPEQLLREAEVVGRLLHPNIVTLFEAGEVDGVCFLVLEHVSGGSAAASLRQNGPFDWTTASRIVLDVCHGLAAAHAVGLIHRDIKPANILLLEPENASPSASRSKLPLAKLTDFGLARASDDGACVGTPRFMAPEQSASGISNPTTDIYSLGATYFNLLTGSPPFEARTLVELQEAHRTAPIPDVRKTNPAIPEACARIVRRCLAKSSEERYPTVEHLIADLDSLLISAEKPRPSRRRYLVLALSGLAALGLAAGIVAIRLGAPARVPDDPTATKSIEVGPWEPLFNGRDLTGWQTRDIHGVVKPDKADIFAVKVIDEEPTVWVSGKDGFYLATLQEYENYHLSLEYRWLPPVPARPNSGVLYHCNFREHDYLGHEFDLWPPNSGRYSRSTFIKARINVGILHQGQIIPGVEVEAASPLSHNWEHEPGKWNQLDLICVGDSALHVLNSKVVLALTRSRFVVGGEEKSLTRGRIMFQSRRGAIAYRHIKIRAINGIPPEFWSANGG